MSLATAYKEKIKTNFENLKSLNFRAKKRHGSVRALAQFSGRVKFELRDTFRRAHHRQK